MLENDEVPDLMTPQEVAQLFRVDPQTVRRWVARKLMDEYGISVVKTPGNHNRFHREDIERVYKELNGDTMEEK